MIKASRTGLLFFAFVGSAVLGGPLLVLWGLMVGYGSLLLDRYHVRSGIYAVAGGFSKPAVMLVMLLCGTIGAIATHYRLNR